MAEIINTLLLFSFFFTSNFVLRTSNFFILRLSASAVIFLFYPSLAYSQPEVRGLWVVRDTITTPEKVKKLVQFADNNSFNVLFVQVRGRGDAFYHSYFVPGPEDYPYIPSTFDPLEEIIKLAHDRNIEVHAWFNMYLTWSADTSPSHPEHPLNKHPEWFMVSVNGLNMAECPIDYVRTDSNEGRYISPELEAVRGYLSRVITEVTVTYNIDGIHLDYVRYPGRDYNFHPNVRQDFSNRYGVDPREVVKGNGQIDPALMYLGKWVEYRAEQIDKQLKSIRRRIKLVDPNIRLSAAVKAHADEAYYQFGQNWAGWVQEGLVDFVVTMSYFPDSGQLYSVMSENVKKAHRRKIIGGIGVYMNSPLSTAEQISLLRDMDLLGYCFFSYTTFLENPGFAGNLAGLVGTNAPGLPREFKPYLRTVYE